MHMWSLRSKKTNFVWYFTEVSHKLLRQVQNCKLQTTKQLCVNKSSWCDAHHQLNNHDIGTLSWLNAEALKTAQAPLFGRLVRCTAHGHSFARLWYYIWFWYMLITTALHNKRIFPSEIFVGGYSAHCFTVGLFHNSGKVCSTVAIKIWCQNLTHKHSTHKCTEQDFTDSKFILF